MIQFMVDKENKYFDDLLFHLRKHNVSFTGEKLRETKYVYAFKETVLVGALVAELNWDWVGINNLFYENESILKEMMATVSDYYKDKAVGLKLFTNNKERANDFASIGFDYIVELDATPYTQNNHYLEYTSFDMNSDSNYITVMQQNKFEEYEAKHIKEVQLFEENNHDPKQVEELLYIALDGETFVGGVRAICYPQTMHVHLLAVNNDYLGQNVGTNLMNYVEDYARKKEMYSIDLGTAEFQARPFYEKLGYKVIFTRKNYPKGFETYSLIKYLKEINKE